MTPSFGLKCPYGYMGVTRIIFFSARHDNTFCLIFPISPMLRPEADAEDVEVIDAAPGDAVEDEVITPTEPEEVVASHATTQDANKNSNLWHLCTWPHGSCTFQKIPYQCMMSTNATAGLIYFHVVGSAFIVYRRTLYMICTVVHTLD